MTTKIPTHTRNNFAKTVNRNVSQQGSNVNASRKLAARKPTRTLSNSGTRGCKSCGQ